MAKNKVVAGDYLNKMVTKINKPKGLLGGEEVAVISAGFTHIYLDKDAVKSYEVMTETQGKSAVSAVGRAGVGAALLGPIGLAAGLSAKSKGTYTVAIEFKDGKKSLLEIDEKIFKVLQQQLF